MTIRAGTRADAGAVLAPWRRAGSASTVTDDHDSVMALLERDPEALLVAECEGAVVGSLIAGFDGWRGSFHRLAVAPEHRRAGLARALVDAGIDRLRAAGVRRVLLIVERDDEQAMATWRALGFVHDDHITRFYLNL